MASNENNGPDLSLFRRSEESSRDSLDTNSGSMVVSPESTDHHKTTNPTFIQNQVVLQRNPSLASAQNSLARASSTKSNVSYDAGSTRSSILGVSFDVDGDSKSLSRSGSSSSAANSVKEIYLKKSASNATQHSLRSRKSDNSVQSLAVIGDYPLGSLRIHEAKDIPSTPKHITAQDVILVTNTCPDIFLALDTVGLTIGKEGQFYGFRNVPSGAHFLYAGSGAMSGRTGFWLTSDSESDERGSIHVKRWDRNTETLEEELSQAEIRIQKDSVPALLDKLLPYDTSVVETSSDLRNRADKDHSHQEPSNIPFDHSVSGIHSGVAFTADHHTEAKESELWPRLTSCISGVMLTKLTGHSWNKWKVSSTDDCKPTEARSRPTYGLSDAESRMEDAQDKLKSLEYITDTKDRVLSFTFSRNAATFSKNVSGRQRTEQALDTSAHIDGVISAYSAEGNQELVIGELQFCFLTGILLGNMACMEQWSWIVKLLFRAYTLSMSNPILFRKVIDTVHMQLIYNEQGLDGSIFEADPSLEDDLKIILTTFKSRLNEQLLAKGSALTSEQQAVGKAFETLETYLWKMEWDLRGNYLRSGKIQLEDGEFVDAELQDFEDEDERGEYAPTVVEMDENGQEKGILRWDI